MTHALLLVLVALAGFSLAANEKKQQQAISLRHSLIAKLASSDDYAQEYNFQQANAQCMDPYDYSGNSPTWSASDIYFTYQLSSYPDSFCGNQKESTTYENWIWTTCFGGPPFSTNWIGYYQVANPVFRYHDDGTNQFYCWVSPTMYNAWGKPAVTISIPIPSCGTQDSYYCPPHMNVNGKTPEYTGPCPNSGEYLWNVASGTAAHGCVVKMTNTRGDYCHVTSPAQFACLGNPSKTSTQFNMLPEYGQPLGDCKC